MLYKRVLALLVLTFGILGVIACLAGIYAASLVGARLERANQRIFAAIDMGLEAVQNRVHRVEQRVKEARITTGEITEKLREWPRKEAKERLVTQFEIESRTEKLAGHLQTADLWLEASTESIRGVQQMLELGHSLGAHVDPASLEEVLGILASLRGTLQETERTVADVRAFATGKEGESEESRLARVLKVLARIVLTISALDTRLERFVHRVAEIRTDSQQLKVRTSNYIFWTTIGCYLFFAWMAVGQAALCAWGAKRCWRRGSSATQPAN